MTRVSMEPGQGQIGVVAAVEPIAPEIGAEVLRQGGNASDAAIATAFAQGIVNPIYCGIGGAFSGIFHDAARGATEVVVAGGHAPLAARADMWAPTAQWGATWSVEGRRNEYGYQASTVPGFIRGAFEAFTRFGSGNVSWADLIAPSIELAAGGFVVYPYLYRLWMPPTRRMPSYLESGDGPHLLGLTEESRRIFLSERDDVPEVGDVLVQPDYARTLRRIADNGPDEFYAGETGERIVEDFQRNGGLLTKNDLRDFEAEVVDPIGASFHEMTVLTEPSPSVGPVILEILNILEGWDLRNLGWNSAPYLAHLASAMHPAFVDRMNKLGDPRFVEVPQEELVSKDYAATVRNRIDTEFRSRARPRDGTLDTRRHETTHVSAIDKDGNAASITHSIGNSSGVVTPGLGFLHNSNMVMFNPTPGTRNSIEPGKRPITGGGPTLVLNSGQAWLAIGSPGGAWKVTAIVQALLNMTQFGMSLEEAIAAERIHVEDESGVVRVQQRFPPNPLVELGEMGYRIRYELYTARLAGVMRDADSGVLFGSSDPRGGGGVAAARMPLESD